MEEALVLVAAVLLLSSTLAASGRVLRVPVGPADRGATEGDRLLVRRRRGLLGHPAGRRLLQPQHRPRPLLLGHQQLLPKQQGQGRHLRLQRRRHHLHHRPQLFRLHFPFKCQCCWNTGHHNRRWRDDGHLQPRHGYRDQRHGAGRQPGTGGHGQHGRRGGRLASRRSAGCLSRRHHPLLPSSALAAPLLFSAFL